MANAKTIWLEAGYARFAELGPLALQVEVLSRKAGINKSSFYHHFADTEGFIEALLKYHLEQVSEIARKEAAAVCIDPELVNILLEHKTAVFFNRQLRLHQHNPAYKACLFSVDQQLGPVFALPWMRELNLQLNARQLETIYNLAIENFYVQIQPASFTQEWLINYFNQLKLQLQVF
jgi:AcrR family transcriptional regulator